MTCDKVMRAIDAMEDGTGDRYKLMVPPSKENGLVGVVDLRLFFGLNGYACQKSFPVSSGEFKFFVPWRFRWVKRQAGLDCRRFTISVRYNDASGKVVEVYSPQPELIPSKD